MTELTEAQKEELAALAVEIDAATLSMNALFARRLAKWQEHLRNGVSKGSIARASGVTHSGLNAVLAKVSARGE